MSSIVVTALAIGAVAALVPVLMSRFPPAPRGSSPHDGPQLERRNRPLKLLTTVVFFVPLCALAYLWAAGEIDDRDGRAAALYLSLAFLLPPLVAMAMTIRHGRRRLEEFARYVELSDRVSTKVLAILFVPVWIASLFLFFWGAAGHL